MQTELLTIAELERACELLRAGKLVAIPTETVYGLAANALDPRAARAIYAAKGRPGDNPLIVHVSEVGEIAPLVKRIPDALYALAARFWPGPMTVILEKSDLVPYETSGGLETVAIRIPSHPIARALICGAGVPLAAPSANLSGLPSPTCARHCIDDLAGRVDAVVDGGDCAVGVESTVLTLCTDPPSVLRPGAVTLEMLREVLPAIVLDAGAFEKVPDDREAASPGMKYQHYSPKARVVLVRGDTPSFRRFLDAQTGGCGALCFEEDAAALRCPLIVYGAEHDPDSQARRVFDALREVDARGWQTVYVRIGDESGVGQAVYNRLLRAAGFDEVRL